MSESFDQHCVVELMGHSQIAGKVTEATIGGASFIRVDVPETSKRPAFTKFYSHGAIYAFTAVEQSIALAMAEALNEAPIQEYRLKTVEIGRQLAAPAMAGCQVHDITQVERYISTSGNHTWKAYDDDGYLIYLRQAHRDLLTDAGLWDQLNTMPVGATWDAEFTVHTVPDGDFKKPVQFEDGGQVVAPDDSDSVDEADEKKFEAWATSAEKRADELPVDEPEYPEPARRPRRGRASCWTSGDDGR